MPIVCPLTLRSVTDEEFATIDKAVMACAYASQNQLGRLCEERVYENDVAARLRAEGIGDVHSQAPLTVSHRGFTKILRLDLVVNSVLYEFKAADALVAAHEAQAFTYAALLGLDRVKLVNFGAASVEGKLRRCPFAGLDRRQVTVCRNRWQKLTDRCDALAADAEAILRDWGGYLETPLYEEALVWLHGGEAGCVQTLPVTRDGLALGHHRVNLIAHDVAFEVTALERMDAYERQLRRLLDVLPIRAWQWINIHHANMTLVTLRK